MHNPSVLFLDEPTTGLDPPSRLRVWEEVRRLNREIGHLDHQYLEEAESWLIELASSTPAASWRRGHQRSWRSIGTMWSPRWLTVTSMPSLHSARLVVKDRATAMRSGCDRPRRESLSPVALALDQAGVAVKELSLRTPTLDDVFLDVTGTHLEGGQA